MRVLDALQAPAEIMSPRLLGGCQTSSAFCLISSGYPKLRSATCPKGRIAPRKSRIHVSPPPIIFAVEVTNRAWIRAAVAPFAQRKFSILLDTRTFEEQYQFEVSLFEARLPLLSPFTLKDKRRIERQ